MDRLLDLVEAEDRAIAAATARRSSLLAGLERTSELHDRVRDEVRVARSAGLSDGSDAAVPVEAGRSAVARDISRRSLRAEVATTLRVTERAAERLLDEGAALFWDQTATFDALESGALTGRHASVILDALQTVPPEARDDVEARAIAAAPALTASELAARLRRWADDAQPESLLVRHERARQRRDVTVTDLPDGMSVLEATLPTVSAHAVRDRLTRMAKHLQGGERAAAAACTADEQPIVVRTLGQLRADVAEALLLDAEPTAAGRSLPPGSAGIRGEVVVTVPVLTLAGQEIPALLNGITPVDPETARRLTADAPTVGRILTDPETGVVLSVSRTRYRPPADLRHAVELRDGTCRFPGCRIPARRCEIDHTIDWAAGQGATALDNLMTLCTGHHTLKHAADWTVRHDEERPGTAVWTAPSGREHRTSPTLEIAVGVVPVPTPDVPSEHAGERPPPRASGEPPAGIGPPDF